MFRGKLVPNTRKLVRGQAFGGRERSDRYDAPQGQIRGTTALKKRFDIARPLKNGINILPAVEADSLSLSKSLLVSGGLCSILAASTCKEELENGTLVSIPMRPPLVRTLCAATLQDKRGSPVQAIALEEIKKAVQENE